MISCVLSIDEDIDTLHKIFSPEKLISKRASCKIIKTDKLEFHITAKDPTSMRAFVSSILKIIETYKKINETGNKRKD